MDREAAGQLLGLMRKEIRKARIRVGQHLCREVKTLTKKIDAVNNKSDIDEQKLKRLNSKRDNKLRDIEALKKLDWYGIATKAVLTPIEEWKSIIQDQKIDKNQKLVARISSQSNIQKQVARFKAENPLWDSWLPEFIEMRIKKKAMHKSASESRFEALNQARKEALVAQKDAEKTVKCRKAKKKIRERNEAAEKEIMDKILDEPVRRGTMVIQRLKLSDYEEKI